MAITVTLDDEHAVGGFLTPGDSVNVMCRRQGQGPITQRGDGVKTTAFLLPGLKVLAVGVDDRDARRVRRRRPTTSSRTAGRASLVITFEVTPRQAEQLVQAQALGDLYLTLNPPSFKPGDFKNPAEVVETINLFDQPLPLVRAGAAAGERR